MVALRSHPCTPRYIHVSQEQRHARCISGSNWQDCPRFATADASVDKLRGDLKALDLSLLPQDVSKSLEERRRQIVKVFHPKDQRKRIMTIMKKR